MKAIRKEDTILSQDTTLALKELVNISRRIVAFTEQETQNLVRGDLVSFALTQKDKEKLAERYAQASQEFRRRLSEFRGCNSALLMQLDGLQKQLHEKTEENNVLIDQLRRRATANTRATLFTAQEMGQRVHFPQDEANNNSNSTAQEGA